MQPTAFKSVLMLVFALLLFGCTERTALKPMKQFIGRWELSGRKMLEGIQVDIKWDKEEKALVGRIVKLNDNKYVQLFASLNDKLVSGIRRTSNFQFILTENKIAKELFGTYELSGSQEFNVEFIDSKTIGLAKGNANPGKSTVVYRKIFK